MNKKFNSNIVCAYLYTITKYGYPPPVDNYIKQIEEMAALGFESVELEGIREEHLTAVYKIKDKISDRITDLKIRVPHFCTVLPGLSSTDENVRKEQIKLFERGCEIAVAIGAKSVLDNGPLPPFTFKGNIPITRHYDSKTLANAYIPKNLDWKKYWLTLIETMKTLCDIAKSYGLTYQIHPAEGVLCSTTDGFLNLFDAVRKDNLKFTFDTANQFAVKENLSMSLHRLKDHIEYIHISDNSGERIEHLELTKGRINWDIFFETLDVINYKGELGLDIGGSESNVQDLDSAYINSAEYLQQKYFSKIKK